MALNRMNRRNFLKAIPVVATVSVVACATYPTRPKAPVLEEVEVIEAFDLEDEIRKDFIAACDRGHMTSPMAFTFDDIQRVSLDAGAKCVNIVTDATKPGRVEVFVNPPSKVVAVYAALKEITPLACDLRVTRSRAWFG